MIYNICIYIYRERERIIIIPYGKALVWGEVRAQSPY